MLRKKPLVDHTLVSYVADVLIDHLSGVTVGRVDEHKGTIRLVSHSTNAVSEITIKRVA